MLNIKNRKVIKKKIKKIIKKIINFPLFILDWNRKRENQEYYESIKK